MTPDEPPPDAQGELRAVVDRTRSAVLNVLVGAGVGIAASGLLLRGRDTGATRWPKEPARYAAFALLFALIVASVAARRLLTAPKALREPGQRVQRYYWGHLAGALIGALAVVVGFVYAYAVQPNLEAVAPFWIAALALGWLSLPRTASLEAFDPPA
jgi:uncharacterized membrane protein YidH (DUF202 family)